MDASWIPVKADHLEISQIPDGYLIREPAGERLHYLNRTATLVFELCDGRTDAAAIPTLVQQLYGLDSPPVAVVEECLGRLVGEGLLHRR